MLVDEYNKSLYNTAAAKKAEAEWYTENRDDHEYYDATTMDDIANSLREEATNLEAAADYMVKCWHDREKLVAVIGKMGSLVNGVDLR